MATQHAYDALYEAETRRLYFDWSLKLRRKETNLACEYWQSRRPPRRAMPARADLKPSGMKDFMPNVGLIDVRLGPNRRDYFIRLAGSKWEDVFGAMKGKYIEDFLPPKIEERWRAVFDSVFLRGDPVRVTTRIMFQDKTWLATEMFVGPLSDDGATVSMLLMCFTSWPVGVPGR